MEKRPRLALTVAVAQFDAITGDLATNVGEHVALLDLAAAAGARVIVFPELSLTGYCTSLLQTKGDDCAVDLDDPALSPLRRACQEHQMFSVVGAPVMETAGLGLCSIAIGDTGETVAVYHKMYLDSDEQGWFVRGNTPCQVTVDGWNLGIGICYDGSFPEHARGYAVNGADAYLISGAFPLGRSDRRRTIYFPARALENTMYVAFSNYVGSHDGLDYGGMSAIDAPNGDHLSDAGTTETTIAVGTLDDQHLIATRNSLQMLRHLR